jgi:adenylosuccinate synthase
MGDDRSRAFLVVGLAFGDCGKGAVVDFLARRCSAHTVVRFNGGPQAGHNVVAPDGRHHTFSQFGSGTFVPRVRTLLSRFMLIEPYAMLNEATHLQAMGIDDAFDRLMIDARCPVITPAHQVANRLREIARGPAAHGTCGLGIGELMQDQADHPDLVLRAGDLPDERLVARKLRDIASFKHEMLAEMIRRVGSVPRALPCIRTLQDLSWIDVAVEKYRAVADQGSIVDPQSACRALNVSGTIVFEGAQGVLLDESAGFHPHTTWSKTTFANADALLNEMDYRGSRTRVGVLRTYFTRHGAGPFVSELQTLAGQLPEPHNHDDGWQGRFRLGVFDAVAARYALAATGPVDMLALTHLDRLPMLPPVMCTAYRDRQSGQVVENLSDLALPRQGSTARLTETLGQSQADYADCDLEERAFIRRVAQELRTPVGLVSSDPTWRGFSVQVSAGADLTSA